MKSDAEQLAELQRELMERRAQETPPEPRKPNIDGIPPAMTAQREAELARREAHAARLDREGRIAFGLRQLERQRGARYVGCRLGNLELYADQEHADRQRGVLAELHDYCEHVATNAADAYGVFLYGPCGTGKDHLAMAVARAFIRATTNPVKWVCGAQMFQELRDSFDGRRSEAEVLSPYKAAPLLWISDPLPVKGELSDFQASALYRVIDQRYSARRPTMMTANLNPGEADARFGAAIARRLRETMLQVHCNWPSYRR